MKAETLTHTETIAQESFQDYSKSYAELGHIVMNLPIVHQLPQTIASLLPKHYKAVSLGSGDGHQTRKFVEACKRMGKEGTFINVDPFITQENVLKLTSEQFIHSRQQKEFDLILLQCSFHFNKDQSAFFIAAHRSLKDTGKIVIIQMGNECIFPWTPTIQNNFLKLLLLAQNFIPKQLFKWEQKKDRKQQCFNKQLFRKFLKQRGWSNLLTHSEEEIQECLDLIDSQEKLPNALICIWQFIIEKL